MSQALKESPEQGSCIQIRAGPVAAGGHPPAPPLGHGDVLGRPHQELTGGVGAQITFGAIFFVAQAVQNSF